MTRILRVGAVIALLCAATLLCGCPTGAAGRQNQQNMPAGMLPPPGLDSGGAQTVMGSTTITAPNESYLLVKFSRTSGALREPPPPEPKWQSCRRVIPLEWHVLIEGLNYDGRDEKAEKDVNQLIPSANLTYFLWKYEPKPAPPAETKSEAGKKGK